jgi:hypothetical protein
VEFCVKVETRISQNQASTDELDAAQTTSEKRRRPKEDARAEYRNGQTGASNPNLLKAVIELGDTREGV